MSEKWKRMCRKPQPVQVKREQTLAEWAQSLPVDQRAQNEMRGMLVGSCVDPVRRIGTPFWEHWTSPEDWRWSKRATAGDVAGGG